MQFNLNLSAGVPTRQDSAGRMFAVLQASAPFTVAFFRHGQELDRFDDVTRGFKARTVEGFTHLEFRSAVNCAAKCVITEGNIDFDVLDSATVDATIVGPLPLPVDPGIGDSPANPVHVVGIAYEGVVATGSANVPAAVINDAGALVVAANANRRALRITNLSADPVAIGAPGLTWANRCIVLEQGDMWTETEGAPLAWHAITAAGTVATVTAQEVTA